MDFQVIWSDEAIKDLHDICLYIAEIIQKLPCGWATGSWTTLQFWQGFHSSVRPIPEEQRGRYAKLSFAPIGSSMMYPKNLAEWKSCMFGMLRETSRRFELPNLAQALDAARVRCLRSRARCRRASDAQR